MGPNDYVLHECNVRSNLKAQSCVDIMLVSTSGLAEVTTTVGISSKNLKIGGERKGWIVEASLKQ